jgi:hypothetical protein
MTRKHVRTAKLRIKLGRRRGRGRNRRRRRRRDCFATPIPLNPPITRSAALLVSQDATTHCKTSAGDRQPFSSLNSNKPQVICLSWVIYWESIHGPSKTKNWYPNL